MAFRVEIHSERPAPPRRALRPAPCSAPRLPHLLPLCSSSSGAHHPAGTTCSECLREPDGPAALPGGRGPTAPCELAEGRGPRGCWEPQVGAGRGRVSSTFWQVISRNTPRLLEQKGDCITRTRVSSEPKDRHAHGLSFCLVWARGCESLFLGVCAGWGSECAACLSLFQTNFLYLLSLNVAETVPLASSLTPQCQLLSSSNMQSLEN